MRKEAPKSVCACAREWARVHRQKPYHNANPVSWHFFLQLFLFALHFYAVWCVLTIFYRLQTHTSSTQRILKRMKPWPLPWPQREREERAFPLAYIEYHWNAQHNIRKYRKNSACSSLVRSFDFLSLLLFFRLHASHFILFSWKKHHV